MRIVIVGAGKVGFNIARRLSGERQDVVLVDREEAALRQVRDALDCQVVEGSGSTPSVLAAAGIEKAEMIIAVTDSDEVNTVACLLAANMASGIRKVARIRGDEYQRVAVGVDYAINPEREAADHIHALLRISGASDVVDFADGRVKLIALPVAADSKIADKSLIEIRKENEDKHVLIAAIVRGPEMIVPRGRDIVRAGDILYVMAEADHVKEALALFSAQGQSDRRVMIYGGANVGRYVATDLEAAGVKVKIIEEDTAVAAALAVELRKAVVLRGSASDKELLVSENVADMDTFVAVSRDENVNILVGLLAKHLGARRVIVLTDNLAYMSIVTMIGADIAISPRLAAVASILQFVRKGNVQHVTCLHGEDAEALDVVALETSDIVGKPLKNVAFPEGAIVGAVEHNGSCKIADGETVIHPGDRLFIFSLRDATPAVEKLLTVKLEYF